MVKTFVFIQEIASIKLAMTRSFVGAPFLKTVQDRLGAMVKSRLEAAPTGNN